MNVLVVVVVIVAVLARRAATAAVLTAAGSTPTTHTKKKSRKSLCINRWHCTKNEMHTIQANPAKSFLLLSEGKCPWEHFDHSIETSRDRRFASKCSFSFLNGFDFVFPIAQPAHIPNFHFNVYHNFFAVAPILFSSI